MLRNLNWKRWLQSIHNKRFLWYLCSLWYHKIVCLIQTCFMYLNSKRGFGPNARLLRHCGHHSGYRIFIDKNHSQMGKYIGKRRINTCSGDGFSLLTISDFFLSAHSCVIKYLLFTIILWQTLYLVHTTITKLHEGIYRTGTFSYSCQRQLWRHNNLISTSLTNLHIHGILKPDKVNPFAAILTVFFCKRKLSYFDSNFKIVSTKGLGKLSDETAICDGLLRVR